MKMKLKSLTVVMFIGFTFYTHAQTAPQFTKAQTDSVLNTGSGISGPGHNRISKGLGWRTGYEGVMYDGPEPSPEWLTMNKNKATGSAVKKGLLPDIKPIWELHIRDTKIILGGDGYYYMSGSTGDNIWSHTDGVELYRSKNLESWEYLGLVWTIEKDGTWEKQWANMKDKPVRAIWAPELHYVKGTYVIVLSMAPGGISILKSTTGKPEGPYQNIMPEKPIINGIDATLFQDDDGKVYFTWSGGNRIYKMKDDLSGFDGKATEITLAEPDTIPEHHAPKCVKRGMKDFGHEGAVLFKANGKYYLGAADDYEGRYSTCIAMSDNIYGPYKMRHETVPCGGGTGFFKDKKGQWWCSFFGNDAQAPFREKPAIVKIRFDKDGKILIAENQKL